MYVYKYMCIYVYVGGVAAQPAAYTTSHLRRHAPQVHNDYSFTYLHMYVYMYICMYIYMCVCI